MSVAGSRPTRAVIDLDAIAANVATLRALVAPAALCVVVKADGYGHGSVRVARAAAGAGADAFAVAVVEEGVELRDAGVAHPILVLSDAPSTALDDALAAGLELTASSTATVDAVAAAARRSDGPDRGPLRVHLKVDTGMHRIGCRPVDAPDLALRISSDPGLELASIWTHLAVADDPGRPVTSRQLERLDGALAAVRDVGVELPVVHAANSAGAIAHPAARRDLVRVGIAAYGLSPSPEVEGMAELRPALALVSAVSAVRVIEPGEGVSYGHHFVSSRPTTIATVPIGYADGVPRRFGLAGGTVLIGGRRREVVGAVTMDQLMVDCGDDDQPMVGDEVVLIGAQGDEVIGAWEWASLTDTIAYEIVCGIGSRVPRIETGSADA